MYKRLTVCTIGLFIFFAANLDGSQAASVNARLAEFTRPDSIPFPADNPYTLQKAALGKALFFDPRVSAAQNMTCASCHNPSFGWEAPLDLAVGAMNHPLGRHSPTTVNRAWGREMFWDGRAPDLERQAIGPITADVEMNMPMDQLVERLNGIDGYRNWFADVFGNQGITEKTIAAAIATYERTIVSMDAPFDQWVAGNEAAISPSAKRGFELFSGKANCAACHSDWNFTDEAYHDIGLATADIGRANFSQNPRDKFTFKTPGLREIGLRAPYMHNGSIETLEDVVWHYASGGIERPSLSPKIFPLDLSDEEVADLVAFLSTLDSTSMDVPNPILPTSSD